MSFTLETIIPTNLKENVAMIGVEHPDTDRGLTWKLVAQKIKHEEIELYIKCTSDRKFSPFACAVELNFDNEKSQIARFDNCKTKCGVIRLAMKNLTRISEFGPILAVNVNVTYFERTGEDSEPQTSAPRHLQYGKRHQETTLKEPVTPENLLKIQADRPPRTMTEQVAELVDPLKMTTSIKPAFKIAKKRRFDSDGFEIVPTQEETDEKIAKLESENMRLSKLVKATDMLYDCSLSAHKNDKAILERAWKENETMLKTLNEVKEESVSLKERMSEMSKELEEMRRRS